MAADAPLVGQIVEHYFVWNSEHEAGRREGAKPRPCVIVAVEQLEQGTRVTILPITTRRPKTGETTLQIPGNIEARAGIDPARKSWLVLDEANVFTWPGFDLVPQSGGGFVRGMVTSGFFRQVVNAVVALRGHTRPVDRDV